MSTEIESVSESDNGPSTAKDVTHRVSALDIYAQGARDVAQAGARPTYQHRLKTDSLSRPPLTYQSGNVSKLDGFAEHGAALAPAVTALDAMHAALASVIDARSKSERDPTLMGNEGAAVLKVAAFADRQTEATMRKVDAAAQHIQAQIKSTEADLNRAVSTGTSSPLAAEIRGHAKAQKSPMQFVSELIANGDAQGVSACLGAPAYLSGLTPQMREALTKAWNVKQQPGLTARLALLQAAGERLDRAGAAFVVNLEKAMGVRYDTIQKLRAAQTAASFG